MFEQTGAGIRELVRAARSLFIHVYKQEVIVTNMEAKKESKLFRERSMEAIESPESMNDYLQVTSPGVWIVLAAVIAILIGALLWSIYGRIYTSVDVAVISSSEGQVCYVPFEKLDGVMSAGIVAVNGHEYALRMDADTQTVIISESTNPYIRVAGDFQMGDLAVEIPIESDLSERIYSGTVTTESLQPISLLLQ